MKAIRKPETIEAIKWDGKEETKQKLSNMGVIIRWDYGHGTLEVGLVQKSRPPIVKTLTLYDWIVKITPDLTFELWKDKDFKERYAINENDI